MCTQQSKLGKLLFTDYGIETGDEADLGHGKPSKIDENCNKSIEKINLYFNVLS